MSDDDEPPDRIKLLLRRLVADPSKHTQNRPRLESAAAVFVQLTALALALGCQRLAAVALAAVAVLGSIAAWQRLGLPCFRNGPPADGYAAFAKDPEVGLLKDGKGTVSGLSTVGYALTPNASGFYAAVALAALRRIGLVACLVTGACAEESAARLLAGAFLVTARGVTTLEVAVLASGWVVLLRYAAEGHLVESWGPVLLLLTSTLSADASLLLVPQAARRAAGVDADDPGSQQTSPRDRTFTGVFSVHEEKKISWYQKAVACFPDWSPPTTREIRKFRQTFVKPSSEQLLTVLSCTVKLKGLSHHGRLYISVNHVGFSSETLLRKRTEFIVSLRDIAEVKLSEDDTSHAELVLSQPVAVKGMREMLSSLSLSCRDGLPSLSSLVRRRVAVDNGDDEDEDEEYDDDADEDEDVMEKEALGSFRPSRTDFFDDRSEPFQHILDAIVPDLDLQSVVSYLHQPQEWADDSFLMKYYNAMGGSSIRQSQLIDDQGDASPCVSAKIRELTLTQACPPAPLVPKTTGLTVTLRIIAQYGDAEGANQLMSLTIETCSVSHDVPFGTNFLVQTRSVLTPSREGVKVVKAGRVIFLKSCGFLQGTIRKAALAGLVGGATCFISLLRERAEAAPLRLSEGQEAPIFEGKLSGVSDASAGSPLARKRSRTESICTTFEIQVWEVQRRTTIFQEDWRAPFLPHDGVRRWRWVDKNYRKHPWIGEAKRCDAAVSDLPPIVPAGNWRPVDEWRVSEELDDADADGWQYSNQYYKSKRLWQAMPLAQHIRRRLWTCTFYDGSLHDNPCDAAIASSSC